MNNLHEIRIRNDKTTFILHFRESWIGELFNLYRYVYTRIGSKSQIVNKLSNIISMVFINYMEELKSKDMHTDIIEIQLEYNDIIEIDSIKKIQELFKNTIEYSCKNKVVTAVSSESGKNDNCYVSLYYIFQEEERNRKNEYLTAKEACNRITNTEVTSEKIWSHISAAIERGEYRCTIDFPREQTVEMQKFITEFKKLGYRVIIYINLGKMIIRWD